MKWPNFAQDKKREEEERQELELEDMREIPWSVYDDGNNAVSIEVLQPPDDTLPHQGCVTPTRYSPVAPGFVSQTVVQLISPAPMDVEGLEGIITHEFVIDTNPPEEDDKTR